MIPSTAETLPAALTLTVFLPPDACCDEAVADGRAHRRVARRLLLRILREHELLRRARAGGLRVRPGRPKLHGVAGDGRFDHVVGRLDTRLIRGRPGRFQASFHRGVDQVARVTITVFPRGARRRGRARVRAPA